MTKNVVAWLWIMLPGLVLPLNWDTCFGSDFECAIQRVTTKPGYNWYEARDICLATGGDLVTWENHGHVPGRSIIGEWLWTGMNRLQSVNRWEWSDGSSDDAKFSAYFGPGERNKKCIAINPGDFGRGKMALKILNCGSLMLGFICKRRNGDTTPTSTPRPVFSSGDCPSSWIDAGTDRCYKNFVGGEAWADAEKSCLSLPFYEPNLACANTGGEINVLTQMLRKYPSITRHWFGLFRESADGPWMWADNSRMNGTNFHRYIEQDFDYGGGVIDNMAIPAGSWDVASSRDGDRGKVRRYICQVKKDPNY
jgi:hypothetical protein